MQNVDKKDTLKNKFQEAEIAINSEMKYKINETILKSKTSEKKENNKFTYFGIHILIRAIKISFKTLRSFLTFLFSDLVRPLVKIALQLMANTYFRINEKKQKKEIAIENYFKKMESRIEVREAKAKIEEMEEIEVIGMSEEYERTIRKNFEDGLCTVAVIAEKNEYKKASKSLAYEVTLFDLLATKLNNSRLITNIEYMSVTTTVEKLTVTHVIEFELKISGQSWATVFSKFISSEIHNEIEWLDGKTDGQYLQNLTQIKDSFVFVVSHQRLELQDVSQDIKNNEEKLGPPPFDLSLLSLKINNNQDN
jgi:hypothetical protein